MATDKRQKKFANALRQLALSHGHELVMNVDWDTLMCVIASCQLALRHPGMPTLTRQRVRGWVDKLLALMDNVNPDLAELLRLGDMPEEDQPIDPAPRRG